MVVLVATGVPVRSLELLPGVAAARCALGRGHGHAMGGGGSQARDTRLKKETQNVRSEEREDSRYELYVYGLIALIYEAHSLLDQGVPFDLHSLSHASRPSGFTV